MDNGKTIRTAKTKKGKRIRKLSENSSRNKTGNLRIEGGRWCSENREGLAIEVPREPRSHSRRCRVLYSNTGVIEDSSYEEVPSVGDQSPHVGWLWKLTEWTASSGIVIATSVRLKITKSIANSALLQFQGVKLIKSQMKYYK
ncbi:hypothetical protein TNCV_212271 [Trichonephila clavipes]|nr:hypothetical protein TNCV_212271 [Trichonephila clavipes]